MSDNIVQKMSRQGDILPVAVPATSVPIGNPMKSPVIAYGEVTGHSHAITSPGLSELDTVVDEDGNMFVFSKSAPITLSHEEHGPHTLAPATWWRFGRQREYDPVTEERRLVAD